MLKHSMEVAVTDSDPPLRGIEVGLLKPSCVSTMPYLIFEEGIPPLLETLQNHDGV